MRRRRSALWVIATLAVASLTGCATGVCAGAAQWPPGVWLDASAWLAAHPGSAITACLDGNCKHADSTTADLIQLVVPYRSPAPTSEKATYPLTITSRGSSPINVRTRVTLREFQVRSPCGTDASWQADARLGASGRLTVWHGSGPFPPEVPHPITTTPSGI